MAPERDPFDMNFSTMNAMTTNGAIEMRANADKLHHGVTEELSETMATGRSCVWVKVKVKAKKKSFQPNITQNMPATTKPGMELGNTTLKNASIGEQPSIIAISSNSLGMPLKKSIITQTAMGISKAV